MGLARAGSRILLFGVKKAAYNVQKLTLRGVYMRKEGENLFKWLWRKYNEFYDEAGFSQVGGCRRCVPFIKEDPPLERQDRLQKLNEDTRQLAQENRQDSQEF